MISSSKLDGREFGFLLLVLLLLLLETTLAGVFRVGDNMDVGKTLSVTVLAIILYIYT